MSSCLQLKAATARLAEIHALCFDQAWDQISLEALINKDFHFAFGLKDENEVQSFVIIAQIMDEAEILTLATDPSHRNKGYATDLISFMAKHLYALGCKTLTLEVATDNLVALGLYQRSGFKTVGRRKDYYKRPNGIRQDAEIMALSLAQMVAST